MLLLLVLLLLLLLLAVIVLVGARALAACCAECRNCGCSVGAGSARIDSALRALQPPSSSSSVVRLCQAQVQVQVQVLGAPPAAACPGVTRDARSLRGRTRPRRRVGASGLRTLRLGRGLDLVGGVRGLCKRIRGKELHISVLLFFRFPIFFSFFFFFFPMSPAAARGWEGWPRCSRRGARSDASMLLQQGISR